MRICEIPLMLRGHARTGISTRISSAFRALLSKTNTSTSTNTGGTRISGRSGARDSMVIGSGRFSHPLFFSLAIRWTEVVDGYARYLLVCGTV